MQKATDATEEEARQAIAASNPGIAELAALISPAAANLLEPMAQCAEALTRAHFGRTVSLYVPLYLSNHCSGGCAYCGFAADRKQPRHRLEEKELTDELEALGKKGFQDVLLLTGERTPEADFDYLRACVSRAAQGFHNVTIEAFAMSSEEYALLSDAGCTGMTLYQETYDPVCYEKLHRWGPKRDYHYRLEAPERALSAGFRTVGIGALLGLADPRFDALSLFRHVEYLRRHCWRGGVMLSFPRICEQLGHFEAPTTLSDAFLAQLIFAFRICLPDVPLVLSTRERPKFRDGVAGVGISRMSVASKTTVGGYHGDGATTAGQFDVSDTRDIDTFCAMLREKHLEPVFKSWDAVFQGVR